MNFQDPTVIAAYIGVGGSGLLAIILKARTFWVREKRDVTYDSEQTKWVEGLQTEIRQLRDEKDRMFAQRLQDVTIIAELKSANEFLAKEVDRMRKIMESMEHSMSIMKERLKAIDSTLAPHTDYQTLRDS